MEATKLQHPGPVQVTNGEARDRLAPLATAGGRTLAPDSDALPPLAEQFARLFDATPNLVVIFDGEGQVVFANTAFRNAVGASAGVPSSLKLAEWVHPYDRAAVQAWLRPSAPGNGAGSGAGGESPALAGQRIRLVLRGPNGRDVPVEGSATGRPSSAGSTLLHGVFVDLSEQERHQQDQHETSELIQLLGQHAPMGVFVTDRVGRLRFTNRRWRALAELSHVPKPRGVWWQMVHPDDRDRVLAQWQAATHGGHEFACEHRINRPETEPRWVRTCIAQSWTQDGRPGAGVGITEDITLQRQATEVLRKAQEDLEGLVGDRTEELLELNRELTKLVYAITHDLKAPLRGIGRLADWLAEDHAAQLPAEGQSLIVKLQTRVRQLYALIDGILAYSRIGRSTAPDLLVDPNELVRQVSRLLDPPPGYTIAVPAPLPPVTGIPHELHQLFQSLIDNAIKFSDKPAGRIQITAYRAAQAWTFVLADNGPGIAERYHDKVFALFQRLDTSAERPGAGIGLALAKRIVETRGGTIGIDSTPGTGATFHFTWPDRPKRTPLCLRELPL